jgi:hypothetical protein
MRKLGFIGGCLLIGASLVWVLPGVAAAQTGKLVVIVEENEAYDSIVGNSQAPYLNQLIAQGELFTNYTAVASGSTPDYLAMTSGLTTALSPPSPNIFQAIDGSGTRTWKEFMESMPGNCAQGTSANIPGTNVPLYTASHDPDYQYRASTTCSTNDVPMTTGTFIPASLPDLSYIVPNQCDDMHTLPGNGAACPAYFGSNPGTSLINMGDNWLATVVPQLLAQPNVTVVITWDEGTGSSTPPEHIVTLEAGAGVTAGSSDGTAYNHYGLEAGLYNYFGLGPAPNNGATATPLPIPPPMPAPAPTISSFTPSLGWPGSSVTISGSAFTGATSVTFNSHAAAFTVVSDTTITATVPSGALTGPITVTTPDGSSTSSTSFGVMPALSSFSPTSGKAGTIVTISGSAFTGATSVTFNGVAAPFSVTSYSQITATLPAGATTGPIAVTTVGGTGVSQASFSVRGHH